MAYAALCAHEHREHAAHEHDPLKSRVSITIAVLVVLAATSESLQTIEAGGAIIAANHAVLEQNKASYQPALTMTHRPIVGDR